MSFKAKADDSRWRELRRALMSSDERVKVGILTDTTHETEGDTGSISMLELAAIHEFGAPAANIPERSFLRATMDGRRDEINQTIEAVVGGALKSLLAKSEVSSSDVQAAVRVALGKLGLKVTALVRETIRKRLTVGPEDQALKPATIKRKGSSLPLVDTGQLINSITHAVVDKDEEDGIE